MAQHLIQTQEQKLQQVQKLTQQQMLQVKLMEMPVAELEENVHAELDDNPALEVASDPADGLQPTSADEAPGTVADPSGTDDVRAADGSARDGGSGETDDETDDEADDEADRYSREQDSDLRQTALDNALEGIGRDDEMPPAYAPGTGGGDADYEEMVYGTTASFYDKMNEQVGEHELSGRDRDILEYLIGSLDDDGLLRKDDETLCDELNIFNNVQCTTADVARMAALLKTFDPAGIGARSLQECLMLQLERRPASRGRDVALRIIGKKWKLFAARKWKQLRQQLSLTDADVEAFRQELQKLNPKPGAALGEAVGRNMQQITPDFIVDTQDDGTIRFSLNQGDVPELKVSPSFTEMVDTYRQNRKGMSRQEKEALLYAKEKVEKARGYIEAIRQRRATMTAVMKAIIDRQRKFFLDGDEADLRPMVLKDLAAVTGLDISTVSRVCNVKYVQTNWGTFPLRFFFSSGYTTGSGEELSTRNIKLAMRSVIDHEDKTRPLSDEAIAQAMAQRNLPIARRTVAKYREQMGIPSAKQRRE